MLHLIVYVPIQLFWKPCMPLVFGPQGVLLQLPGDTWKDCRVTQRIQKNI